MDKLLHNCEITAIESILQVLRTTGHPFSRGASVMQLLYDTEFNLQKRRGDICILLFETRLKFTNIEKLVLELHVDNYVIPRFLKHLPNLKIFKGVINKEEKFLYSLRTNCPKLETLAFSITEGDFLSSDQLSSFFFAGRNLDSVKKAFVKLEDVTLSFPKLKNFSMIGVGYEHYDFFKMFFHFYKNVNFGGHLNYSHVYLWVISWFDAVLSHNVVLNPDIGISQCELNVQDIVLPFCEKSLERWNKLDTLLISLGSIHVKKTPAVMTSIGKRLENILKQNKIKMLCIRIQGPITDDEVAEVLYPSLKSYGERFNQLKILGESNFLSHRVLIQVVNMCPNVRRLILVGGRISKYYKDAKLKPLPILESLSMLWAEEQTSAAFCQWVSKVSGDFIRSASGLKFLFCTANIYLTNYMTKMQFGTELEKLVIYFHTDKSCGGLAHLKKILGRLPKLEQLVVKDSHCGKVLKHNGNYVRMAEKFYDPLYNAVKSMIDKTQISLSYYTFEDAQVALY